MKLRSRFADMITDLVGKDGRLVVFIDDLDRCTPDKIPDLLEAIKLFTTTPKCVYVLGLDHDIVRQGIYKKYQFEKVQEAAEYLEKIVQVPFHLPPLDKGMVEKFIQEYYPEIHERCPTAAEVFSRGLEPNPRKVKRALNIYRTLLELADKRVELNIMKPIENELLAKVVVIQSRFRRLYEDLVRHPTFLTKLQVKVDEQPNVNDLRAFIEEHEKEEGEENNLVDEKDLQALLDMLSTGDEQFPKHPWRIRDYIFLTTTAEGTAWLTNITPEEAKDYLLGSDQDLIQEIVDNVLKEKSKGEKESTIRAFVQSLWPAYESTSELSERELARYALLLFRQDFEPEMVPIIPEKCTVGSTDEEIRKFSGDGIERFVTTEKPRKEVDLSEYLIGKFPVTNSEYLQFVEDQGDYYPESELPRTWINSRYPDGKDDHPVVDVSWYDAMEYCRWLSKKTGKPYRLPSEDEWEKAARGPNGFIYPWGNEWDKTKCNTLESEIGHTTAQGHYSGKGDSHYNCTDMVGNVLEWCMDNALLYEKNLQPGRGGSYEQDQMWARCAARAGYDPDYCGESFGFRVVIARGSNVDSPITIYDTDDPENYLE